LGDSEATEIEAIKRLKARYFRFLDTKDWEALRKVFTEDFVGEYYGPHPDVHFSSADEMVASNREILGDVPTVHHGHMPEIEITGSDSATGIWAMVDIVRLGVGFVGYGHYHDVYRKVDGEWLIARTKLTRLLVDGGTEPAS
jgi:hypothetical protein